ncbi:MAG: hypothetical protein P8016_00195 [Sedimentisphaerales bacterium]
MNKEHKSIIVQENRHRMGFSPCRTVHSVTNLTALLCAVTIIFLSGCGSKVQKPLPVCPGKSNVTEALAALQAQSENIVPLFTNKGTFSIEYYDDDEMRKQHFNIRVLLIKPPSEIYMQASTGIIDKAMVLGSNEKEFWLQVKPEISSYWWGLWSKQSSNAGILINPRTLLEALGIAEIDTNANWSLSNESGFDILTKRVQGMIIKKLHIYCCDYTVRQIDYYDNSAKPTAVVKLDNYKEVAPGLYIPFSIVINSITENIENTFNVDIKLSSIKPATQRQQNFPITRPEPKGYDHIYQVINGQWIEQ